MEYSSEKVLMAPFAEDIMRNQYEYFPTTATNSWQVLMHTDISGMHRPM